MPKLSANYLTINPNGTVSAEFSGHVSAAGIDLVAATGATPAVDNQVKWHKDTMTGATVATEYGIVVGTRAGLVLQGQSPDGTSSAEIDIVGQNGGGALTAITALAGGVSATVLDAQGSSKFLQLPGAQRAIVGFGTGTCTYNGVNVDSPTLLIPHGLPASPRLVLVKATNGKGAGYVEESVDSVDATNIGVSVRDAAGVVRPNGWNVVFNWFAVT